MSSDDDINEAMISALEKRGGKLSENLWYENKKEMALNFMHEYLQKITNMYVKNEYNDDMVRNIWLKI